MYRIVTALLLLAVTVCGRAHAQQAGPCRSVAAIDSVDVELQRPLFVDDDEDGVYSRIRTHLGIQKLAPGAVVDPIRDPAVCTAWLTAIDSALNTEYGPTSGTSGYLFQMVQFGPYMVVSGNPDPAENPPEGIEFTPLFIFDASTKTYIGKVGL
jgi:hypothetical protein